MASFSNDVVMLPASEVGDQAGDVPSQQSSLEEGESCTPKASEYFSTSSITATEPRANESAEFIESKPDDSAFMYFPENIFHGAPNISKGNTEFATESQIDSALKSINFEYAESNQSTVTQEIRSNKAIESDRSEKSQPNKLSNVTISTQILPVEENMLVDSQATNLRDASAALGSSDSRWKKDASNFSSVNTRIQFVAKDLKPLVMHEKFPRIAADLSNSEIKSDSSGAAAKDIDNFNYMQNTQEYKGETHFKVLNQSGSGGLVVTTPTTTYEPIFPKIEIPPLPPTMDYSIHSANPSTSSHDSAIPMDTHVNMSLSKLESTLARWVNRGLEKVFNRSRDCTFADFIKYSDNELKCVLDILKQMKVRVDTLLTAVDNLPDPTSAMPQGMEIQNNSIRNDVNDAGMKVWRKLEFLEADAAADNDRFVSICFNNSAHEYDGRQLEIQTLNIICNAYVKISENFYELNYEIETFRDNIRDFCSELESFL